MKALEQLDNIQLITYLYTPTPSHSILAPDPGWVEECTHSLIHSQAQLASQWQLHTHKGYQLTGKGGPLQSPPPVSW